MTKTTHLIFALLAFSCGPQEDPPSERAPDPTGTVCLTQGETEVCTAGWRAVESNGSVSVWRGKAQDDRGCVEPGAQAAAWPASSTLPSAARDATADMVIEGCRFQAWDLDAGEVRDTADRTDFTVTIRPVDDGAPGAWDCQAGGYQTVRCAEVMARTVVTVRADVPLR